MKKLVVLAVILCVFSSFAFAQSAGEGHAAVGDFMVNAGINFGWYGFGVGGGAEYIFAKWDIPNFAPLSFGGAGRVAVYFPGFDIDIAALATAHFGLKTFSSLPPWLRNFDWYYGLGLGVGIGDYGGVGISTGSGICYYLNPTLAISADYFYTNYFGSGSGSSGTLGVRLEL
jgi:opacity protein-like surface antigen